MYEGSEELQSKITRDIKEFVGFKPKLIALPHGSIERFEGKAKRLVRV